MQATPTALQGMFTTFDTRFQLAYAAKVPWWNKIASLEPSKSKQNTYGWMQDIPILRKWVGDRQLRALASYAYTLVNDDYELTVEVDKNTVEDDTYGVYSKDVDMMGWNAKKWPDYMVRDVLQTGETTVCYDGNNFFDAAHPINKYTPSLGTYANYYTGKPLTYDNYQTVRTNMMIVPSESGQPMGIVPDLLVVPPQLEGIGRSILTADSIAPGSLFGVTNVGAQQNMMKGTAELLVLPELANQPLAWYLLCTSMPILPFLFQMRAAPEFVFLNRPTDYNVVMQRKFILACQARGAAGQSVPFLAAKATG